MNKYNEKFEFLPKAIAGFYTYIDNKNYIILNESCTCKEKKVAKAGCLQLLKQHKIGFIKMKDVLMVINNESCTVCEKKSG